MDKRRLRDMTKGNATACMGTGAGNQGHRWRIWWNLNKACTLVNSVVLMLIDLGKSTMVMNGVKDRGS